MQAYCEQPPASPLARWIECVWLLDSPTAVTSYGVPPDGCLDIVYHRGHGLRAIGTMTTEQRFHFPEGAYLAGIRFRPGMAKSFLGVPASELTDGAASLEDLWPRRARELTRQLDDAISIRDVMRILIGKLPAPAPPSPVQQAIEALAAANGSAGLDSTARQADLSPRQFRRRCLEESGLTPKRLCRVLRFRHASRIAATRDLKDWSSIALESEYFDQAHLIHDFNEFTGRPPMAVFSNTPPRRSG